MTARVAVIGAGVVGLSAAASLAAAGADVVTYERGTPMAERSVGDARIFRYAHAAADLVALAMEARRAWGRWERETGRPLIGAEGTVVTGRDVKVWADAMRDAGAAAVRGPAPAALPGPVDGEALVDPAGGVIDAAATAALLIARAGDLRTGTAVTALDETASGVTVTTAAGAVSYDAVVLAAGAGTAALAAAVGLDVPTGRAHHLRCTFPLAEPADPPCWIDHSPGRPGSYQQRPAPGVWAVGVDVPEADAAWSGGRERTEAAYREAALAYVREHLPRVEPRIVGELYCVTIPGLGDGVHELRTDRVVSVYGENLFKFAPLLGDRLAAAALEC